MTRILLVFLGLSFSSFAFSAAASAGKATEKPLNFVTLKECMKATLLTLLK